MQHSFANKKRELRNAMGRFPTGVAIATALSDSGKPVGMTINSLTSISLSPALIAWSIDHSSASYEVFVKSDNFALTVLAETQADLAMRFASRGVNKFSGLEVDHRSPPVIPDACAWFKCEAFCTIPLGDHTMLVGQVVEYDSNGLQPLIFSGGQFQQAGQNNHTMSRVAA